MSSIFRKLIHSRNLSFRERLVLIKLKKKPTVLTMAAPGSYPQPGADDHFKQPAEPSSNGRTVTYGPPQQSGNNHSQNDSHRRQERRDGSSSRDRSRSRSKDKARQTSSERRSGSERDQPSGERRSGSERDGQGGERRSGFGQGKGQSQGQQLNVGTWNSSHHQGQYNKQTQYQSYKSQQNYYSSYHNQGQGSQYHRNANGLWVDGLDLKPVTSTDDFSLVIHGTYYEAWEKIKHTGLKRMNKNHIHFAGGEPGQNGVISGMRSSCEVIIYLDLGKALKDGLKFFQSAKNVILCEGDKDGYIYPCYFSGVLDRQNKSRLDFDHTICSVPGKPGKPGQSNEQSPWKGKKSKRKNKNKDDEELEADGATSRNGSTERNQVVDDVDIVRGSMEDMDMNTDETKDNWDEEEVGNTGGKLDFDDTICSVPGKRGKPGQSNEQSPKKNKKNRKKNKNKEDEDLEADGATSRNGSTERNQVDDNVDIVRGSMEDMDMNTDETKDNWDEEEVGNTAEPISSTAGTTPFTLASRQNLPQSKAQHITMKLANHIIQDMRPFSQIDSTAFRELILECEPRFRFPSRNTIKENIVPRIYEHVAQIVRKDISGNVVSVTTDSWTSRATKSYVTITAHYIPDNFTMQSKILQTRELEVSHTGENIGEVLRNAATEWGISMHGITTDNASNMKIAAKSAGVPIHLGCFAHTLNLASKKAVELRSVNQLLGKIRVLVTFFHKSTTASAILREKQTQLQVPEHKLIIDVKNRWNSSYLMVERFLEQQVSLMAAMDDDRVKNMQSSKSKTCTDLLSPDEIQKLELFITNMAPMYHATLAMLEDKDATVGMVLPLLNKLLKNFTESETDSTFVKGLKKAVYDNLKSRYTDEAVVSFLEEAQAMDPRFKHLTTVSVWDRLPQKVIDINQTGLKSKQEVTGYQSSSSTSTRPSTPELPHLPSTSDDPSENQQVSPPRKKSAISYFFEDEVEVVTVDAPPSIQDLVIKEIQAYISEPKMRSTDKPLAYWRDNSAKFPMLSKFARATLSIQASSVPSERVFSLAGDIVTPTRACLDSDSLDMLVFLKKNMLPEDLEAAMPIIT